MEDRKEIKPVLEYTNDTGTQGFKEGDVVICFTESKRYIGTIVAFGNYIESGGTDLQGSLYLDTSKNGMSRSCEVIKMADITYMCKVPASDLFDYPQTNEALDREVFTNMIVGLGYDKEKAEIMYESMREFIALYNIPLSIILYGVAWETMMSADEVCQEGLIEINKKLMARMVQMFQTITDSLRKKCRKSHCFTGWETVMPQG